MTLPNPAMCPEKENIRLWKQLFLQQLYFSNLVHVNKVPFLTPVPLNTFTGFSRHRILYLLLDHADKLPRKETDTVFVPFLRLIKTFRSADTEIEILQLPTEMLIWLSYPSQMEKMVMNACRQTFDQVLQRAYHLQPEVHATISVGLPASDESDVKSSWRSAASVMQHRLIAGTGNMLFADQIKLVDDPSLKQLSPSRTWFAQLSAAVKLLNTSTIHYLLRQYRNEHQLVFQKHPNQIVRFYRILNLHLIVLYVEAHGYEPIPDDRAYRIENSESIEEMEQHLSEVVNRITNTIRANAEQSSSDVIDAARHYISAHLDKSLHLSLVAERIHFSPSYVGARFREELDITFTQYVKEQRVEMARTLLQLAGYSVQEIAEQVGYHDPKRFSRHFKEIIGVTPTVYRG